MGRTLLASLLFAFFAFLWSGCGGGSQSGVTLSSVAVTPASATVSPGTSRAFRATGLFSDGSSVDLTATANWNSSNLAVATISNAAGSSGVATGVATGSSTISATSAGVTGTATLTTAVIVSIAVTPVNPVVVLGTEQQFTATATFSNGATQNITGQVTWSSSDSTVATVDAAGGVQATGAGQAAISASAAGVSGRSDITVATLTSLALTPQNPTLDAGSSQQFTVTGTLSNGDSRDVTSLVTLTPLDPTIVSINGAGLATALAPGSTVINASYSGVPTRSTGVTVLAPASITVAPANAAGVAGSTQQFTATGRFADGSSRDLTSLVTWNSSAPAVASISNSAGSRGVASALANGVSLISATMGVTGSTTFTVRTLSSLAVTPSAPSVGKGVTLQLAATGTFSDGSTQELTGSAEWLSSSPATASVSNLSGTKGLVTGNALGKATVTASVGGVAASSSVTVIPGNEALVTDFGSNLLSVLDAGSSALLTNLSTGSGPFGVAALPSATRAYVVNSGGNNVSVVDLAANTAVTTINVGGAPWGAAVIPSANRLYVTNSQSSTVSVIDTGSNKVVATIPVGSSPRGVAVNAASNRIYVANAGSNSVSVIDGTNNSVIGTVAVGLAPLGVAVDAAANRAYVTNNNNGTVTVIDTALNLPVATIVVGSAPWGVAVRPGTGRVYVANNGSNTLSVIDAASASVAVTVAVGSAPRGVTVTSGGNRIFVANFGSNSISVVDPATNGLLSTIPGFIGPTDIAAIP